MKEVIYLRVSRRRVEGMTKRLPDLERGEIPVKLTIEVDAEAFHQPVIEHQVHITDWREGIDIGDVELRDGIITEAEAQIIRSRRLAKMQEVLRGHGYQVTEPEPEADDADV